MNDGSIAFAATLDNSQLMASVEESRRAFDSLGQTATTSGDAFNKVFSKIGKYAAGAFSVAAAQQFAKQIIAVRGEIESLETSFKSMLGSEKKAADLMAEIREYAAHTPMQMNDLAAGAQTMLGFNIEAEKVMPLLKAMGDISMGNSQKFQALTLAFSQMSSTGRLMGQDLLQMINAGFNPLVQIAETTGKSVAQLKEEMSQGAVGVDMVTKAFMDATAEGGKFHGMLEEQSKGIRGSMSNIQGALNDMFNEIGEKVQEPTVEVMHTLQKMIENYKVVGEVILGLVSTYGAYKAAVMAYNAAVVVSTQVTKGYTMAQQLEYYWLLMVEKAQKLVNKSMMKNPYALAAAAVVALVSAIVIWTRRNNELNRSLSTQEHALEGVKQRSEEVKKTTDELIATLNDESATDSQHYEALQKLNAMYPDLAKKCKTYNDYLAQRKDILAGMPKAQEDKEMDALRERVDIEERLMAIADEYARIANSGDKGAAYKKVTRDNINFSNVKADRKFTDKLQGIETEAARVFADYQEAVENGFKDSVLKYVSMQASADKEVLKNRQDLQRKAEFDAKPLEQRIEITETSLKQAEGDLDMWKRIKEQDPLHLTADLNIGQAEAQIAKLKAQLNDLNSQKVDPIKTDFAKEIRDAEKALKEARKKMRDDNSAENQKAVEDAEKALEDAQKAYKSAYGKSYDQAKKEGEERTKRQKDANEAWKQEQQEFSKWQLKEARDAALEEQRVRVEGMADGFEKEKAQMELNNAQRLAAFEDYKEQLLERVRDLAEAQWKAQNPEAAKNGKKFDRSSITSLEDIPSGQSQEVNDALAEANALAMQRQQALAKQMQQEEQTLMKKQLEDVKTYLQQREEIEQQYAARRKALSVAGATEGNVKELNRQEDETLKALDEQFAQRSEAYQQWCNDIAQNTYSQLVTMLENVKGQLATLEFGDNVDEQQLATLRAKITKLTAEIERLKREGKDAGDKWTDSWRKVAPIVDDLGGSLAEIGDTMEQSSNQGVRAASKYVKALSSIAKSSTSLIDNISKLAKLSIKHVEDAADAANEGMKSTAEGASKAMQTAEKASAILAIISAAYKILSDLKNLVGDMSLEEKMLDDQERQYNAINDAIAQLERESGRYFGKTKQDILETALALKQLQLAELERQLAAVESGKDTKKNRDEADRLRGLIVDLKNDIFDTENDAAEAIFGESVQESINNFADALTNAWAEGKDASKAAHDYMREMMKKTVREAILDYIQTSAQIEKIREKVKEAMKDGILSDDEKNEIEGMTQEFMNQMSSELEWMRSLFVDENDRSASAKGIARASQESVDENNGRLTFIQGAVTTIKEHTQNISDNSNILRDNVTAITSSLGRMERTLRDVGYAVDEMHRRGVKIRQ